MCNERLRKPDGMIANVVRQTLRPVVDAITQFKVTVGLEIAKPTRRIAHHRAVDEPATEVVSDGISLVRVP